MDDSTAPPSPPHDEAVSPVIGVILMVAITVVLAAVVFMLANSLSTGVDPTPTFQFSRSVTSQTTVFTLTLAPGTHDWSDFTIADPAVGCTVPPLPTGPVTPGDRIEFQAAASGDCIGQHFLIHGPTNGIAAVLNVVR